MRWVVALVLLWVAATFGWLSALLLLGAGFLVSLHLHPYTRCEACNGTRRHPGSVFTYGFRPCATCSGTGRKQRFLARWQGLGEPRKPGRMWF
jgi:hypothetical protein